jgi:hypothetical protein
MNIQKMLKQAQQMQAKIGEVQAEMEASSYEGIAGSGAVKLVLTGKGEMKSITLDAAALDDKETLEDLIVIAHRDAKKKADDAVAAAMGNVTGGMGLPGGFKLPF